MACNPLPIDPQGQMQPPTPPQDSLCPYKTSKNEEPVLSDTGNRACSAPTSAAGKESWWRSGTPARWRSEPAAVVARGKTVAPAACHTDLSHPKVAGCAWELSWAGGRLSWARADCRSLWRSLGSHTDHTPSAGLLWVRRGPQRPRHCVCSCGSLGADLRSDSQWRPGGTGCCP